MERLFQKGKKNSGIMTFEHRDHLIEIKDLLQKKLEQAQQEYYTLALETDTISKDKTDNLDATVFIEEMYENKARLLRIIDELSNNLYNIERSGDLLM